MATDWQSTSGGSQLNNDWNWVMGRWNSDIPSWVADVETLANRSITG